ncbi:hypothetical protein MGLY_30750 [Neomoorella glycerini]|uniref:HepT-like domain-containing protein n=1 Tax=Neomoorella glycerini TaxID=55779 RepID=A0A6I5ZVD1_9FIRM|nr:hypothetical protein [Moorella glycerini]QGP93655.1 hypothetical protein MGLY_30750 [Moorella glycerini]
MTGEQFLVLEGRIRQELENMARLKAELAAKGLITKNQNAKIAFPAGDSFFLRATGSILHDFYVAAENIFKTIAREIDHSLPADPEWHRQLLVQMTLDLPELRPYVIQKETAALLDEYRGFRHVFRNVYGFNLAAERLERLVQKLPETLISLRQDLQVFLERMREVIAVK